jgi:transcriptional regulator
MSHPPLTTRQQILQLLEKHEFTAREIAEQIQIPAREVESHLEHLVKSLARHPSKGFLMVPSACQDCEYFFAGRKRLTTPSRCPKCRSEFISPPRFRIVEEGSG